jgi:site-specific recombinase XerD
MNRGPFDPPSWWPKDDISQELWREKRQNFERIKAQNAASAPPPRAGLEVDPKQADLKAYLNENPMADTTRKDHVRYLLALHKAAFEAKAMVSDVPVILGVLRALQPVARSKAWSVFNRYFTWRLRKGSLSRNPLDQVKRPPRASKPKQGMPREDLVSLVKLAASWREGRNVQERFAGQRFELMITFMLHFGLRSGELLKMTQGDLLNAGRSFTVQRKEGRTWTINLDHDLAQAFRNYGNASVSRLHDLGVATSPATPVWLLWNGRAVNHFSFEKQFNDALRRAGLVTGQGGPHQLRHTMAQIMVEEKRDLGEVGNYLGHFNLSSTDYYLKHHFGVKKTVGRDLLKKVLDEAAEPEDQKVLRLLSGDVFGQGEKS